MKQDESGGGTDVAQTWPRRLAAEFPDLYGRMDPQRLGILIAAAWLYLGGNAVNERTLLAFFRTLAQPDHPPAQTPPAPDRGRAAPTDR